MNRRKENNFAYIDGANLYNGVKGFGWKIDFSGGKTYNQNMTTKTYEKIKKEIKQELMQELVLPILRKIRDSEGEYKEKFVKEILKSAQEKPKYLLKIGDRKDIYR